MRQTTALFATTLTSGLLICSSAFAQQWPKYVHGSGEHVSGGGTQGIIVGGHGMGVGEASGGGITARFGFVPRRIRSDDREPPVITDPDDMDVSTDGDACSVLLTLPDIEVEDAVDPNPDVVLTIDGEDYAEGDMVRLDIGSHDVLVTATDDAGNEAQAAFRIDVSDRAGPQIIPVPDPTPVGEEAEARSPTGTAVNLNYNCIDACDPDARAEQVPALARYPLGDTRVTITCTDGGGNVARETVTVRVRDTQPPSVPEMPEAVPGECNQAGGAEYDVPRLVWRDNGSNAEDLRLSLIVDPDGDNRVFDELPETVTLSRGAHVLRYVAIDESGNRGTADLNVNIVDQGVPTIQVVDAPQNGWHGDEGDVQVVLEIADGCSEVASVCPGNEGDLEAEIVPPPAGCQADGNEVTLTYRAEGAYRLQITVTDPQGNEATDNTVAFGIDRNPPQAVVRVPSQAGVDADRETSLPIYARAERVAINMGGEDESDGTPSGIANVTVILDPDDRNENRLIADHDFDGNGSPEQGRRVVGGVGCENTVREQVGGVQVRDGYCDRELQMDLRNVPLGVHVLEVTVTDFAGNSSTEEAWFINADLHTGADHLIDRLGEIIVGGQAGAARDPMVDASRDLVLVRNMSGTPIEDTPHETPLFLGTALANAQSATIDLVEAIDAAEGATRARLLTLVEVLQRLSRSDVELMQAYTDGLNRVDREDFIVEAYETDVDIVVRALEAADRAIGAEQWTQAAASSTLGFFHAKSALEAWMMDYDYVPNPDDDDAIFAEYERGKELLAEIRDEIGLYIAENDPPAVGQMRRVHSRLETIVERLERLVRERFQVRAGGGGVTDQAYFGTLTDLREVANISGSAADAGAYVRNYQFSMMQVVRFMTQASVEDAIFSFGGGRADWPIYAIGRELIAEGVGLLDARRVQQVIDLYGVNEDSVCLTTAVYHCDFIRDEGDGEGEDDDVPQAEDETAAFCWDKMLRPSEWDDAAAVEGIIPQCQYTQ